MARMLFSWLLIAMLPAAASAQVSLKYAPDVKTGQAVRSEADVNTNQTLTIVGMPLETKSTVFMVTRETVGAPTAEGGHETLTEVETLQADLGGPGGVTYSFNSNNPDRQQGGEFEAILGDFYRGMSKARWKMTRGPDHKVVSAEYVGEPFNDVHEMFKADVDPNQLKHRTNTELSRYPTEPVKPGDTWKRIEKFQAGAGQTFTFEQEFTLLGSEDRDGRPFDKVGLKTLSVELTAENNPAAPAKVTDSDLKIADSEGTLWYDRQAKRFTETREKVHITGTTTLEVQGMSFPGEVDLTIEVKSKSKIINP